MHPVLKRIFINGGLTAAVLACVGLLFSHLANMFAGGNPAQPGEPSPDASMSSSIRANVPFMMALWGFVFVAVGELIRWRIRGVEQTATKPATPQPDETEKLLNELLAQAEARTAQEQKAEHTEQKTEDREQKTGT